MKSTSNKTKTIIYGIPEEENDDEIAVENNFLTKKSEIQELNTGKKILGAVLDEL